MVALGAAYTSYRHGREFAVRFGADPTTAAIWPLIVDGLLTTATVELWRSGRGGGGWSAWLAFVFGVVLSLCGNIAAAPELSVSAAGAAAGHGVARPRGAAAQHRDGVRDRRRDGRERYRPARHPRPTTRLARLSVSRLSRTCHLRWGHRRRNSGYGCTTSCREHEAGHRAEPSWTGSPEPTTTGDVCSDAGNDHPYFRPAPQAANLLIFVPIERRHRPYHRQHLDPIIEPVDQPHVRPRGERHHQRGKHDQPRAPSTRATGHGSSYRRCSWTSSWTRFAVTGAPAKPPPASR